MDKLKGHGIKEPEGLAAYLEKRLLGFDLRRNNMALRLCRAIDESLTGSNLAERIGEVVPAVEKTIALARVLGKEEAVNVLVKEKRALISIMRDYLVLHPNAGKDIKPHSVWDERNKKQRTQISAPLNTIMYAIGLLTGEIGR